MQNIIDSVAIDTVPLPECGMDGFRFENFFLDQLVATRTMDRQADLTSRVSLTLDAIRLADSYASASKTDWFSGVIIDDGRQLLVDALFANGFLVPKTRARWLQIAKSARLMEFAPSLFASLKAPGWSLEKGLTILGNSFAPIAGTQIPAPGTSLEEFCRKHPTDPICIRASGTLSSWQGRELTREVAVVWELTREKILSYEQSRAVLDVTFKAVTPRRGLMDMSPSAGNVILEYLDLSPERRADIFRSLGTNRVGMVDPDSPWAEKCLGKDPPPICKFILAFPVASVFTTQLVRHEIWDRQDALKAWRDLYAASVGAVTIAPKIGTWPTPEQAQR